MLQSLDRTTQVPSFTGGSYYLIEVIAFILTHLKEKLLIDHLKRDQKSTDFDWVITVPAIWKARARRMMREAAYMVSVYMKLSTCTFVLQCVGVSKAPPRVYTVETTAGVVRSCHLTANSGS